MASAIQNHFKNRDVRGPGVYSIGHIGRPAGGNNAARFIIEQRKREEWNRKNEEIQKTSFMQKCKNKFEEVTERKCIRTTIKNMVDAGMKAAYLDLENRRERLRKLLEEEEMLYKKEAYERAINAEYETYAEKQRRVHDLRMQRENERKKVVEEKRFQQFMNNYEPVRDMITRKNNEKTFCAQLEQLKQIDDRRKSELEEKAFWDEVNRKTLEEKKERAEADAQETKRKMRDTTMELHKQKLEKEERKAEEAAMKAEELREIEKMKEKARLEEMELLKKKKEKRDAFQKLLKEQIAERESVIVRQGECEKIIDHQINELANEELRKQKTLQRNVAEEAQREMKYYIQHMEELKQERLKENRRFEELVETQRRYKEQLRDEEHKLQREAQNELKKEVLAQRKKQIEVKEKNNAAEKEVLVMEAQLAEKLRLDHIRSEKEEAHKNSLAKAKYGIELKQQMELLQQIKEREKEEADRLLQCELRAEKDYLNGAQEILNRKLGKDLHPFRAVINGKGPADCKNDFEYLKKCRKHIQ